MRNGVLLFGFSLCAILDPRPSLCEGLILSWPLREDLRDVSGNGHHGTAVGTPHFAGEADGWPGLVLSGDGEYVVSSTHLPELTSAFTVECWVKPAATQVSYADVLGNHANNFAGLALQQDGARTNCYYFTYGTGSAWVYSATFTLEAETWQHVAAVKTEDRLRIYVDGLVVDSRPATAPMAVSDTPLMVGLGIEGQPRWFTGEVSDVRVYASAHRPSVTASPEVQLQRFVESARVECALSARWGVYAADGAGIATLSVDPEMVPPVVSKVIVRLAKGMPPVELSTLNGFTHTIDLDMAPGYHCIQAESVAATSDGDQRALRPVTVEYFVTGAPANPVRPERRRSTPRGGRTMPQPQRFDDGWLIATDPDNVGLERGWSSGPTEGAVPTRVPWIIQGPFPGYHGVAWYWRPFRLGTRPHPNARTLLRFEAVDYAADVFVNGEPVGRHEGAEAPFELDITDVARYRRTNMLAVRVVNPTHDPIDELRLMETPRRAKVMPYSAGASFNHGGIVGTVEVASVPEVAIEDLYLRPDPRTGLIHTELTTRNAASGPRRVECALDVSPAVGGPTLGATAWTETVPPGRHTLTGNLSIDAVRLWDLADPYLYSVTAQVTADGVADACTERCGFRDFRFEDGAFRLNGRRIYLRSTHTVNAAPVGQQVPADPGLFQRDLILLKTMGFNCIRFIWGGATRRQLEMCDEIGLLVYDEHAASNPMHDSPEMAARFDRSITQVYRRDRNHPSVVIFGLLNETFDGPVFQHAVTRLPLLRSIDDTRVIALNSGRWDGRWDIGSLCNPGGTGWEPVLGAESPDGGMSNWGPHGGYFEGAGDAHVYPRVPHTAETMQFLRTLGHDTGPVFVTEYGIGSAVDLWRIVRRFEETDDQEAEDARYYRERLDRFLHDYEAWDLKECFADPQAFFAASLRKMAGQRTLGLDAIRSNPNLVGYSLTGMVDHVNCGEGLWTLFRELKPGTTDALAEALAPLRLCVFAEPHNVYPGATVRVEVVLATEDVLGPGRYPVRVQVVGPGMARALDETVDVVIPGGEAPLALQVLDREVSVAGPVGAYEVHATMLRGGAPTGGVASFAVMDPASDGPLGMAVTLCGGSPGLQEWLARHGATVRRITDEPGDAREVILVAGRPEGGDEASVWEEIETRASRGAVVLCLAPEALSRGEESLGWLPVRTRGMLKEIRGWLYLKDEWAKAHPIFRGLPAGGLMDYAVYRDIIPDLVFTGCEPMSEAVCGAIKASQDYDSGLMVAVHPCGEGGLLLSTLRILPNLGADPVADRLLLSMLRWAGGP